MLQPLKARLAGKIEYIENPTDFLIESAPIHPHKIFFKWLIEIINCQVISVHWGRLACITDVAICSWQRAHLHANDISNCVVFSKVVIFKSDAFSEIKYTCMYLQILQRISCCHIWKPNKVIKFSKMSMHRYFCWWWYCKLWRRNIINETTLSTSGHNTLLAIDKAPPL